MSYWRQIALSIATLLFYGSSFSQVIENPTSWKYEVKKKSATEYQLIFHLDLKQGWHIWSMNPGGDGFQIIPSFDLEKTEGVTVKGKVIEKGKATTTLMDGVDGKVTYLSGKVDYIQEVTVKGSTKIKGKHTYQVCDDKQCLAPVDKDFVFEVN